MADRFGPEVRSRIMQAIRGQGTGPEVRLLALVELVHRKGDCHITTNVTAMPGRPDVLCVTHRVAWFAHGCFWHGCPEHYREPQTNQDFWRPKIRRNKERDARAVEALEDMGYSAEVIWEHDLK
jgi:DNA mismatch endonuclease (patch repair protein)